MIGLCWIGVELVIERGFFFKIMRHGPGCLVMVVLVVIVVCLSLFALDQGLNCLEMCIVCSRMQATTQL